MFNTPVFRSCSPQDEAKLIPFIEQKTYQKGDLIFDENRDATEVFYIISGTVHLKKQGHSSTSSTGMFIGEEAILADRSHYETTATASAKLTLFTIRVKKLQPLIKQYPDIKYGLQKSLINRYLPKNYLLTPTTTTPTTKLDIQDKNEKSKKSEIAKIIGWCLAITVPTTLYMLGNMAHFDWATSNFFFIFGFILISWTFRLLPTFIPVIFGVVATIILGIVPNNVILSGFSSSSFFMLVSIFGLASVLTNSGLIYRFSLYLLKITPNYRFFHTLNMYCIGIMLTLFIPWPENRVKLISPLFLELFNASRLKPKSRSTTNLTFATFLGASAFSTLFLTGRSFNFLLLGLLPEHYQHQFTWLYWLQAMAVIGGLLFVIGFILSWAEFKVTEKTKISKEVIATQLEFLGKTTLKEWIAGISLLVFIFFVVTTSLHKIQPPWIGLAILYVLLSFGLVSQSEFRFNIDWSFLFYLGGSVGLIRSLGYLGIGQWLSEHLTIIQPLLIANSYSLVATVFLIVSFFSLFIKNNVVVFLAMMIFLPLASALGINLWLMGIIILFAVDNWVFPHQSGTFLWFDKYINHDRIIYNRRSFLLRNALFNTVIKLLILFLGIHYWHYLAIL